MNKSVSVLSALTAIVTASPGLAQCQYEVTIINAPECGTLDTSELLLGLNNASVACGAYGDCSLKWHAMTWSEATGVVNLPVPPGAHNRLARDITMNGTAVGEILMETGPLQYLPAIWSNGVLTTVPLPPTATEGWCYGINDDGVIAGYWFENFEGPYPYVYSDSKFRDLRGEIPLPWTTAMPAAIAKSGFIAGQMHDGTSDGTRGFMWDGRTWFPILPSGEGSRTWANDVNESGVAVGRMTVPFPRNPGAFLMRPIVWTNGVTTELALPEGRNEGEAHRISRHGQIVGRVTKHQLSYPFISNAAAVWIDGEPFLLKSLVLPTPGLGGMPDAWAMNDKHEIGVNTSYNGSAAAAILRPVKTRIADLVIDCRVNAHDLQALLSAWGNQSLDGGGFGDLDGDGIVGPNDLAILLGDWDPTR